MKAKGNKTIYSKKQLNRKLFSKTTIKIFRLNS